VFFSYAIEDMFQFLGLHWQHDAHSPLLVIFTFSAEPTINLGCAALAEINERSTRLLC
jgi:hypothetical protein